MQVFEHIKNLIKDGTYQPGDKLPAEARLSDMFGVSRTPVREALSILEASGLIRSTQGGGSVVQPVSLTNLVEMTTLEVVHVDEVLHLLEVRTILESEAAALAAVRRTDEDLTSIRHALAHLRQAVRNEEVIGHDQDIRLHVTIIHAAHNPVLKKTMDSLSDLYYKAVKYSLTKNVGFYEKRQHVLNEHEHIVDAIARQDAGEAKKAMRIHLQNAKAKLEAYRMGQLN